jgi:hypothetical protein
MLAPQRAELDRSTVLVLDGELREIVGAGQHRESLVLRRDHGEGRGLRRIDDLE